MIVIDCSAVLAYLYPDEGLSAQETEILEGAELIAPHLIDYEVANSVCMSVRRGRIRPERKDDLFAAYLNLSVETLPAGPLGTIFDMAQRHRLTVYDAAYLALASDLRVPLLTRDRALAAAAAAEGVAA